MGKAEAVAAQLAAVLAGQNQALSDGLGACYDAGLADAPAPPPAGGFSQADLDAAVAAAVGPLQAKISQDAADLSAAQADCAQKLAELQAALDAMTAKELGEEGLVSQLQGSVAAVQDALDKIKSFVAGALNPPSPAPAPVPQPEPAPLPDPVVPPAPSPDPAPAG